MLSYKLKHLCSRVIASLSAVGLFSITGTAKAANFYELGTKVTVLDAKTFAAAYEKEAGLTCSSEDSIAVSGVITGVTADGAKACSYILKKGFVYYSETGSCLAAGLEGVKPKYFSSGVECVTGTYSGDTYGMIFASGIEAFPNHIQNLMSGTSGVQDGQYIVTVKPDSNGVAALDEGLLGYEPIRVNFDCKGAVSGTYASNATGYAYTYSGAQVELPGKENCVAPSGYIFSGWAD